MLKKIRKAFIHGGHLQSLGAIVVTLASSFLLGMKIDSTLLILIYLLFYSFYLFNRVEEVHIDYLTNPERVKYILKNNSKTPYVLGINILLISLILLKINNITVTIISLLLLFFGLFYTIYFKEVTKYIPLFKNFYVAACFASLTFYPSLYNNAELFSKTAVLFSIFVFFKIVLIQIFFDIKDIQSDKKENLKTLPVLIGREKTIIILILLSFLITSGYLFLMPGLWLVFIFSFFFNIFIYLLLNNYQKISYYLAMGEFGVWLLIITFLSN